MTVACYKDYSLQVSYSAQAYWAMEGADPLNQLDSTTGPALVKSSGTNAHFSKQPGLIGQCEQIHDVGAVTDELQTADDPALKFSGFGFTIVAWINFQVVAPMFGVSTFGLSYDFDQNGINYNASVLNYGTGNWTATFNGFPLLTRPSAAGWHFLVLTLNIAAATLGFDIDQTGAIFSPIFPPAPGPNVSGLVVAYASLINPAEEVIVQFDEVGLFNRVLTAAQLNYLYHGGAGRTWPISLP